jgi:hypothetical protein
VVRISVLVAAAKVLWAVKEHTDFVVAAAGLEACDLAHFQCRCDARHRAGAGTGSFGCGNCEAVDESG